MIRFFFFNFSKGGVGKKTWVIFCRHKEFVMKKNPVAFALFQIAFGQREDYVEAKHSYNKYAFCSGLHHFTKYSHLGNNDFVTTYTRVPNSYQFSDLQKV